MSDTMADKEHQKKGVLPYERTKSPMSNADSDPNETFYTPNQSTRTSPSKQDRKGSSSSGSDTFYPIPTDEKDEAKKNTLESVLTASPSVGNQAYNANYVKSSEKSAVNHTLAPLRGLIGKDFPSDIKFSKTFHNNTAVPKQVADTSASSPTSENSSAASSSKYPSAPYASSTERYLKPATKMQSRLEAIRLAAVERETAQLTTNPRVQGPEVAGIAPFPTRSEYEAGNTETSEVGTSTRPMTPITEEEKVAEDQASVATTATTATSSNLSALAAEFVPSGTRPIYTNNLPNVPSHWIPLHGASHGSFFDPATSMILGDGPPRHNIERPDGTYPVQKNKPIVHEMINHVRSAPEEAYRVQPGPFSLGDRTDAHMYGEGVAKFYCICTNRWTANAHNCVISPVAPMPAMAIPSRVRLGQGWVTHDIQVTDTSYLDNQMAGLISGDAGQAGQAAGSGEADIGEGASVGATSVGAASAGAASAGAGKASKRGKGKKGKGRGGR